MSRTNAIPEWRASSNTAAPTNTGTREPSFRMNSFSYGVSTPFARSSSTARASSAWKSGGVISIHRTRPSRRSLRVYPRMRRNSSFASVIAPPRLEVADPHHPGVVQPAEARLLRPVRLREPRVRAAQLPVDVLELPRAAEDVGLHLARARPQRVHDRVLLGALLLRPDELRHVLHAVVDAQDLAAVAEDGRAHRAPVPLLEPSPLRIRATDRVLLDRHRVRRARLEHALEGRPRGTAGARRVGGIVREHLEDPPADDVARRPRRAQVRVRDRTLTVWRRADIPLTRRRSTGATAATRLPCRRRGEPVPEPLRPNARRTAPRITSRRGLSMLTGDDEGDTPSASLNLTSVPAPGVPADPG